ncbi:filaggrin-like [Lethenteron reissneri]|uniref:filaggrin-like n=1 Tax=Lethenteron reissneri TaxID=7753 RepID=UPI002AB741EA|nr:filaggrin-like [Lethenteron reissneri]
MGQQYVKPASSARHTTLSGHRYGRRHAYVGFRPERVAPDAETATPASPHPPSPPRDGISTSPAATATTATTASHVRRGRDESDLRGRCYAGEHPRGQYDSDEDCELAVNKREPTRRSTRSRVARDGATAAAAASAGAAAAVTGGAIPKVREKCSKRSRSSNEDSSSGCDVSGFRSMFEAAVAAAAAATATTAASEERPEKEAGSGGEAGRSFQQTRQGAGEASSGREARRGREKGGFRETRSCMEARSSSRDARDGRVGRSSCGRIGGTKKERNVRESRSSSREERNSNGEARCRIGNASTVGGIVSGSSKGERIVGDGQRCKMKMSTRAARSSSRETRSRSREVNISRKKRRNANPRGSSRKARGGEEATSSRGERSSGDDESSGEAGSSNGEARSRGKARSCRKKRNFEGIGSIGEMRSSRGEARSGHGEARSGGEARSNGAADRDGSASILLSLLTPWAQMSPESDRDSSGVEDGDGRDSDNSSWETFSLSDQRVPFISGSSSSSSSSSSNSISYMDYDYDDADDIIERGHIIMDDLDDFDDDDDDYDNNLALLLAINSYHRALQPFLQMSSVDGSLEELFNGDDYDGDESEGETTSVNDASFVDVGALAEEGLRNLLQRPPPWVLREEELRLSGDDGDDEGDGGGADRDDDDDADDGHGDDDDDDASEGEAFFFNSADTAMATNEFVSDFSLEAEVFNPGRFPLLPLEDRLSAIESIVANLNTLIGDVTGIQFQPTPASSELTSSLPVFFINDDVLEQICTICCSEFVRTDQATTLPCCHLFHTSCIEQWLKKSATCPVCRYHLEEEAAGSTPSPAPHYRGTGQRL